MHYTAMLAYRGIGDIASAEREQKLFQRFKADESSQAITAKPRMLSPEDNNERQAIHDHESIDLKACGPALTGSGRREVSRQSAVAALRQPAISGYTCDVARE